MSTETTSTSLTAATTEMRAGLVSQVGEETLSVYDRDAEAIGASDVFVGARRVGDRAPTFRLPDARGGQLALDDLLTDGPVVLVFYRGAWCPYCNIALRKYQANLVPELDARGIALIAVSPQKPDGSLSMADKNDLTFAVLSDPGNQIAGALGILTAPTEDVRGSLHATGVDLPAVNSDGTYALPMVTVAVVDAAGVIRWIDVAPNHARPTEVAEIISALDAVLS
jgi:peroxiredoxin